MASWFGSSLSFQRLFYRNALPPAPVPNVFRPTDLSDCALWLDANDTDSVQVNEDTSGVNLNRVMKWFDLANPSNQNYYTHDGNPANSALYNTTKMNFLNTVSFPVNCFMDHHQGQGVEFAFNDRTFFAVIKPRVIPDASNTVMSIFAGQESGGMVTQVFYDASNTVFKYGIYDSSGFNTVAFDLSASPLNTRMLLMWAHGTDLSGNVGNYDTIYQPLVANQAANYSQESMDYMLNSPTEGCSFDVGEIIMYGRMLNETEQVTVLEYLADKWNLSGPTPIGIQSGGLEEPAEPLEPATPPPEVFAYTYIIYGELEPGIIDWYWCDENAVTESPPVLAPGYDGTTALRDGLAVVVSGVFYL